MWEGDHGAKTGKGFQGTCITDPWRKTKWGGGGLNVGGQGRLGGGV